MARKTKRKGNRAAPRMGNLPPSYKFFLNPYTNVRFTTSCPGCSGKTRQRKLPLAIHVDQVGMLILNKTCRFCPYCDLLIAHRDEIEARLAQMLPGIVPPRERKDYLIVGTVDRKDWRRGMTDPLSVAEMLDALHDFKDFLFFEPPRWEYTAPRNGPPSPRQGGTHFCNRRNKEANHGRRPP